MTTIPYEDTEARIARAEAQSFTLEAFRMAVSPRNFELCPVYS